MEVLIFWAKSFFTLRNVRIIPNILGNQCIFLRIGPLSTFYHQSQKCHGTYGSIINMLIYFNEHILRLKITINWDYHHLWPSHVFPLFLFFSWMISFYASCVLFFLVFVNVLVGFDLWMPCFSSTLPLPVSVCISLTVV